MAVAFTKNEDYEARAADLPDRPVSSKPNLVTVQGLREIEEALSEARAAYAVARAEGAIGSDRTAMARATRDLRYWSARRATAQLTEPPRVARTVQFGRTVRIVRESGLERAFRIVGEDEADPAAGKISYVSPLASATLGKTEGDVVVVSGAEVEILLVE